MSKTHTGTTSFSFSSLFETSCYKIRLSSKALIVRVHLSFVCITCIYVKCVFPECDRVRCTCEHVYNSDCTPGGPRVRRALATLLFTVNLVFVSYHPLSRHRAFESAFVERKLARRSQAESDARSRSGEFTMDAIIEPSGPPRCFTFDIRDLVSGITHGKKN